MKRLRAMNVNGVTRYYWRPTPALRKRGFRQVPLGTDLEPAKLLAERLNKQVSLDLRGREEPPTDLAKMYALAFTAAKSRSRTKGVAYTLSREDEARIRERSAGCCEVSGIPFSRNKPFIPSVDRIDARHGYLPGNTRLVCWSVNLAMGTWGEAVLYRIAKGVAARYKPRTRRQTAA